MSDSDDRRSSGLKMALAVAIAVIGIATARAAGTAAARPASPSGPPQELLASVRAAEADLAAKKPLVLVAPELLKKLTAGGREARIVPMEGAASGRLNLAAGVTEAALAGAQITVVQAEDVISAVPIVGPDGKVIAVAALARSRAAAENFDAATALLVVIAGLGLAALGAALGWTTRPEERGPGAPLGLHLPGPVSPAPRPTIPPVPVVRPDPVTIEERRTLADACIEVRDLVSNDALRERLGTALGQVGIAEVDPSGLPFDPRRHRAAETVPTTDDARHNVVASTARVGYVDHGRQVRKPDVVVYKKQSPR